MQSLRTYAGVSLISLGLIAIGFYGGERHVSASTSVAVAARFVATGKPGFAFDTHTGVECAMDGLDVPPGVTLYGMERCEDIAKR